MLFSCPYSDFTSEALKWFQSSYLTLKGFTKYFSVKSYIWFHKLSYILLSWSQCPYKRSSSDHQRLHLLWLCLRGHKITHLDQNMGFKSATARMFTTKASWASKVHHNSKDVMSHRSLKHHYYYQTVFLILQHPLLHPGNDGKQDAFLLWNSK